MSASIKDSVVVVTGATGAIATALIAELLARGAAKIYAAARDVSGLAATGKIVPLKLDVTSDADAAAAALQASDATLLINNAGVNHNTAFMLAPDLAFAKEEIEINYLAPLRLTRARMVRMLSTAPWFLIRTGAKARVNLPLMGSYCASKAAALSLTQGLRGELTPKGVRIVGALPGAVDTRMTAGLPIPKMTPADAAKEILDGYEAGEEDIYVGDMAKGLAAGLAQDHKAVEKQLASG